MQKTQKTFSCRRKIHPTPGTLSNQLSVTWETRRENWNLPGPVNYATQNGRPCPRTGIFFCKATSAEDRNLQPPKALNKDRTPPKHALARAVEYTALGTGVRAEARPIAHFFWRLDCRFEHRNRSYTHPGNIPNTRSLAQLQIATEIDALESCTKKLSALSLIHI